MTYVDAGYVSALSALALYGALLLGRRRRLGRAAGAPDRAVAPGGHPSRP